MELTILPTQKIIDTYKRYSLPTEAITPDVQTLQFFYIGTQSQHIDKLKHFFEFGYATVSTDNAIYTLQRLLKKKEDVTIPDMIVAEGSLGTDALVELHQFLSQHKVFADIPFIIEGTGLTPTELSVFKRYTFIDDLILMNEFTGDALFQKAAFLKKAKHKRVYEPGSLAVQKSAPVFPDMRSFVKRVLDIVISTSLLLLLGPVMLVLALIIKLESGGPILFASKRTGRGFRLFDMYRFNGHAGKTGWFLRKTCLDELPLLLNVWLGDMSLVGNRPLFVEEAARLTTDEQAKRFLLPVGITGLWDLHKRSKEETVAEKSILLSSNKPDPLYNFWMMAKPQSAIVKD